MTSNLVSSGKINFKRVPCIINHYHEERQVKCIKSTSPVDEEIKLIKNKSLESPTTTATFNGNYISQDISSIETGEMREDDDYEDEDGETNASSSTRHTLIPFLANESN